MNNILQFGSRQIEFNEDITEVQQLLDSLLIITKLNGSFKLEKRLGMKWMLLFDFGHIKLKFKSSNNILGQAGYENPHYHGKKICDVSDLKEVLQIFLSI